KILSTARAEGAAAIGLSGLITPSLDEMVHVAKEMERQGFELPLLIGGATTSRVHTAVKIDPQYRGPVVHVTDAARAVGVVGNLLSAEARPEFVRGVKSEYDVVRTARAAQGEAKLVTLEAARANAGAFAAGARLRAGASASLLASPGSVASASSVASPAPTFL